MKNNTKAIHLKYLRIEQEEFLKHKSKDFEKINWKILSILTTKKQRTHCLEIASLLRISTQEVRRHIQNIRLNNHKYFNPTNKLFILADRKGYYLSDDRKAKTAYFKHLRKAVKSKEIQAKELQYTLLQ